MWTVACNEVNFKIVAGNSTSMIQVQGEHTVLFCECWQTDYKRFIAIPRYKLWPSNWICHSSSTSRMNMNHCRSKHNEYKSLHCTTYPLPFHKIVSNDTWMHIFQWFISNPCIINFFSTKPCINLCDF